MNLRAVTLIAAITQLAALLCGVYSYVHYAQKLKWADNADFFIMQPVYIVANIMLVVFLFFLFARQKPN